MFISKIIQNVRCLHQKNFVSMILNNHWLNYNQFLLYLVTSTIEKQNSNADLQSRQILKSKINTSYSENTLTILYTLINTHLNLFICIRRLWVWLRNFWPFNCVQIISVSSRQKDLCLLFTVFASLSRLGQVVSYFLAADHAHSTFRCGNNVFSPCTSSISSPFFTIEIS